MIATTEPQTIQTANHDWPSVADMAGLSDHQREQTELALSSPVGILAGTPGTGKTYTVARIIKAIAAKQGEGSIAIVAPTGKAAVRLNESLQNAGIGVTARTIHSTLKITRNGYDGKGWGFHHNSLNPLPCRTLIIEETSMLDTATAACLFDALDKNTHVLMVGDPYQLPPVGHGAPFRDLIEVAKAANSQIGYGELSEVQRNAGDGVRVCADIKNGKPFWSSNELNVDAGRNLFHFETVSNSQSLAKLKQLLYLAPGMFHPVWDIQILVAVNEKSDISRKVINGMLQDVLNPDGEMSRNKSGEPFHKFRVGDKVICTSNSMLELAKPPAKRQVKQGIQITPRESGEKRGTEFIANGEIGRVAWVEPKMIFVTFDGLGKEAPQRTVKVPLGTDGGNFDLAYAITCHKSQGSQFPVVIILADNGARVVNREWWYTGLSRFEKLTITIGKKATINRQIQNIGLKQRKTFLAELLMPVVGADEATTEATKTGIET